MKWFKFGGWFHWLYLTPVFRVTESSGNDIFKLFALTQYYAKVSVFTPIISIVLLLLNFLVSFVFDFLIVLIIIGFCSIIVWAETRCKKNVFLVISVNGQMSYGLVYPYCHVKIIWEDTTRSKSMLTKCKERFSPKWISCDLKCVATSVNKLVADFVYWIVTIYLAPKSSC